MATINITGFKLIRWAPGSVEIKKIPSGQVDYLPSTKYRHEKSNAFDPTYTHRREKYHEDSFDLQAILTPDQYYSLITFLKGPGKFYIEFNATPSHAQQFPIYITSQPKCPDDLHEYPAKIQFKAISSYFTSPGYIDFGIISVTQDDDEIVSDYTLS